MSFVNVGFGNLVQTDKIIAIVSPDAAPIKRLVQIAKENNLAIDATSGRRTRGVIALSENRVVMSALSPDAIYTRIQNNDRNGGINGRK
jgi:extracellular matrix regulatory protein A